MPDRAHANKHSNQHRFTGKELKQQKQQQGKKCMRRHIDLHYITINDHLAQLFSEQNVLLL